MDGRTEHRRLYKQIPTFECKQGCTDCCGPVPISAWEADKLSVNPGLTETKNGTIDCVFSSVIGCTVYKDRPFICRLFGTVEDKLLKCPHGFKPDKYLSKKYGRKLAGKYMDLK